MLRLVLGNLSTFSTTRIAPASPIATAMMANIPTTLSKPWQIESYSLLKCLVFHTQGVQV